MGLFWKTRAEKETEKQKEATAKADPYISFSENPHRQDLGLLLVPGLQQISAAQLAGPTNAERICDRLATNPNRSKSRDFKPRMVQ